MNSLYEGQRQIDRTSRSTEAARFIPHVIFRDLDCDEGVRWRCAPDARNPSPGPLIRIVAHRVVDPGGPRARRASNRSAASGRASHHKPYLFRLMKEAKLATLSKKKGRESWIWSCLRDTPTAPRHDGPLEYRARRRRKR